MPTLQTVLHPVSDLPAATALYSALLGTAPTIEQPYYVHFVGDNGLEIGLVPNGQDQGMTGPVNYWLVEDIDAAVEALVAAGATVTSPPREVGGGRKVALLADSDGNQIGVTQNG